MKILAALCFGVLLTACTPLMTILNDAKQPVAEHPADQKLFDEGVEQVIQQQNPDLLLRLKDSYPDSLWSKRADAVLAQAEQIRLQKKQLEQLQKKIDDLSSGKQFTSMESQLKQYATENQRLQKELDTSNKQLEALRELTIELELK